MLFGKRRPLRRGTLAGRGERVAPGGRGFQQGLRSRRRLFVREADHVAGEEAVLEPPPHLLRPRQRRLVGRELEHGPAVEGDELVDQVDRRRAVRDGQARADAEAVDRGSRGEQARDLVLVEVAAREDRHAGSAASSSTSRTRRLSSSRSPESSRTPPSRPPLAASVARDGGRAAGAFHGVVGVDQKRASIRI